jgi:hypothetical protein
MSDAPLRYTPEGAPVTLRSWQVAVTTIFFRFGMANANVSTMLQAS